MSAESVRRMPAAAGQSAPAASLVEMAPFFKAFCNATRASIIEQLLGGERCVCEITAYLGMSQPLISHHLAILRNTGLVRARGSGARTYYSVDWEQFERQVEQFRQAVLELHELDAGPSCACD